MKVSHRGLNMLAWLGACVGVAGCAEDEELTHGFIKVEIRRAGNTADNPFEGTERIAIQMSYEPCLVNFYEANPNWRKDGPDGEAVFAGADMGGEGWLDRLCAEPDPGQMECEVTEIDQQLDNRSTLTVTYTVTGLVENRFLKFGPLPTAELADCDEFEYPTVKLFGTDSVVGFDANGSRLWSTISFSDMGSASTNQGAELVVNVGPPPSPST